MLRTLSSMPAGNSTNPSFVYTGNQPTGTESGKVSSEEDRGLGRRIGHHIGRSNTPSFVSDSSGSLRDSTRPPSISQTAGITRPSGLSQGYPGVDDRRSPHEVADSILTHLDYTNDQVNELPEGSQPHAAVIRSLLGTVKTEFELYRHQLGDAMEAKGEHIAYLARCIADLQNPAEEEEHMRSLHPSDSNSVRENAESAPQNERDKGVIGRKQGQPAVPKKKNRFLKRLQGMKPKRLYWERMEARTNQSGSRRK
ncbi:hypothetical protein QFC21_003288 [Naganishia friedmannii]|uniref:Uncharacterized protein n=1 Tax=Naganishia friedmannii TaxID=89922 RepID=A0ACC2VQA5_9TREE|nr:hypothetical protein QFC21_003288 [Naganishia friedmannii]